MQRQQRPSGRIGGVAVARCDLPAAPCPRVTWQVGNPAAHLERACCTSVLTSNEQMCAPPGFLLACLPICACVCFGAEYLCRLDPRLPAPHAASTLTRAWRAAWAHHCCAAAARAAACSSRTTGWLAGGGGRAAVCVRGLGTRQLRYVRCMLPMPRCTACRSCPGKGNLPPSSSSPSSLHTPFPPILPCPTHLNPHPHPPPQRVAQPPPLPSRPSPTTTTAQPRPVPHLH